MNKYIHCSLQIWKVGVKPHNAELQDRVAQLDSIQR